MITRSEDDLLGRSADEGRDLAARLLDSRGRAPAVQVGSGVRIAVVFREIGKHGLENSGIHTGGRLCNEKRGEGKYARIQIDNVAQIHVLVDQSFVEALVIAVSNGGAERH